VNFKTDFEGCAHSFLYSFISIESSSGRALDNREIHYDSDSSYEFSQDSDIHLFDGIDPDSEISGPDLRGSFSNSDAGELKNVGGGGGDYNDEDDDNDAWAVWDENSHDFYMILFRASCGYKPPRSKQMPVSPDEFFATF
jgi:hypothetical protein